MFDSVVVTVSTTPIPSDIHVDTLPNPRYRKPPTAYASGMQPAAVKQVQKVKVKSDSGREYTYQTTRDVQVGDCVILPSSKHPLLRWRGQVTQIGSDFPGPVKEICEVRKPMGWRTAKSFDDVQKALEDVLVHGKKCSQTYQDYQTRVAGWALDEEQREFFKSQMLDAMRMAHRHLRKQPVYTAADFYRELESTKPA